jgi:hypothetical protein
MRAKIKNGIWTRNVPWHRNGEWRTDIFKRVLADPHLRDCCFILNGGPTIVVPVEELRRALTGGAEHYMGEIWGPFNINPSTKKVCGVKVEMRLDIAAP